jgi:hypothetical protein
VGKPRRTAERRIHVVRFVSWLDVREWLLQSGYQHEARRARRGWAGMSDFGIHFGAMAEPIADQCIMQGYSISEKDGKRLQGIADAIIMLKLHGLIPDSVIEKANRKLLKMIVDCESFVEKEP